MNSFLKMLGLYIDTIIIGHKLNSTLRILNELPLQKELQNFMTNDALRKKTTTKQKDKVKNPCQTWESNPGPHAPQSDALPLDHQDKYVLEARHSISFKLHSQF